MTTRARTRFGSLRVRIVVGSVLLLALVLLTVLVVVRTTLTARFESDVDRRLADEIEQLEAVIREGDPDSGGDFVDAQRLFDTHLRRVLPAEDGAFYALVDGEGALFSFDPPARLLDDPALVEAWAATERSGFDTVETEAGEARVLVVPVVLRDDAGTFVAAVFTDAGREELTDVVRLIAFVSALGLALGAVVAAAVAGRVLRPVRQLTKVARSVNDANLSARLPTDDVVDVEIAELSATFNAMMDRLEDGFASQRRFLDDVAHELRTPITIIQGHLELLGDDPVDREETKALVLDELQRMSRYVGDLLVLAQAERPDFARPEPVDLAELANTLIAKASGLGDRQWTIDHADGGAVRIDRQRITQAVLNLCENAVRHTEPGAEIGLRIERHDRRLRLSVRDTGSGIDPAIVDHIFQRHALGAASRTEGGFGLGLSIVDAIAVAHGGGVTVDSVRGRGTTFTIDIDAPPAAEHDGTPDTDPDRPTAP